MLLSLPQAGGADAVFSQDGGKICMLARQAGELEVIDLAKGTVAGVRVPGVGQGRIIDLERTRSGEFVCLTDSGFVSWDGAPAPPGKDKAVPDGQEEGFADIKSQPGYWKSRVTRETFTGGNSFSVAIGHLGRRQRFGLHTSEELVAAERAAAIYSGILAKGWEAVLKDGYNDIGVEWENWKIAADPASGRLFGVNSTVGYWVTRYQQFIPVGMGCPHPVRSLVFDGDGTCYFEHANDLWHAEIKIDGAATAEMAAYRYAPLAMLQTNSGTPSSMGVESIVVAGPWLYVHLYRIGGSGWGRIIRLAKPERDRKPGSHPSLGQLDGLERRLTIYKEALESVEVLATTTGPAGLAASADGKLVHFVAELDDRHGHWLVREHGQPEFLPVGKEE